MDDELKRLAMNIVNQILDLAGTDVDTRQSINDRCDDFVMELVSAYCDKQSRGAVVAELNIWDEAIKQGATHRSSIIQRIKELESAQKEEE